MKMKTAGKKRRIIVISVAVLALAGILVTAFLLFRKNHGGKKDEVLVQSVASITGADLSGGNRYSGVVESQTAWSVQLDPESTVKEVKVKAGDTVKKGDTLFLYDTGKMSADLSQAQIDLQRMQNEQESIRSTIAQLTNEKAGSSASEQGDYTIRIQEQELALQLKGIDIESKQDDIAKLNTKIESAAVVSEIDGVVRSVNDGTDASQSSNSAFITVMQTTNLQIKGSVNEQNIGELTEGMPVIIHSRVDAEQTWKGTVKKIDMDNAVTSRNPSDMFSGSENTETTSSSYPFYVIPESSEGMMLGQHVYLEADFGQEETGTGLCLDAAYLGDPDGKPFVFAEDDAGRIEKRSVKLGAYNEERMVYEITDGLSEDDWIAVPDEKIKEGMKTVHSETAPVPEGEATEVQP